MQGDPNNGVHDLLIKNVSKEDAGVFECQVSPVAGHKPLRRQTWLFILSKLKFVNFLINILNVCFILLKNFFY